MITERLQRPERELPLLDIRRVNNEHERRAFCAIGSVCFHVPPGWFEEIFDRRMKDRQEFEAWVGYLPWRTGRDGGHGHHRERHRALQCRGAARLPRHTAMREAVMRHAAAQAHEERTGLDRVILQSTRQAIRMYERLGFSPVTRILVFTS